MDPRRPARRNFSGRLVIAGLALVGLAPACLAPAGPDDGRGGAGGAAPPVAAAGVPPEGLEFVPPAPGTYALPPIQDAADGAVVDSGGAPRRLHDYLGGRIALLSFIYTRCADAEGCPLATGVLGMVRDALDDEPGLAGAVRLITVSFDPARDTPGAMRRYARQAGRDEAGTAAEARVWVFLTTASQADLRPLLDGYGQSIVTEIGEDGRPTGDFSHVLKVYLIDRERRVRNIYSTSFLHPATVLNDVKTLLMETAG
jgi:cytochrome oxidase Cu insertion factor (SCO1/SenC/PrrC family)